MDEYYLNNSPSELHLTDYTLNYYEVMNNGNTKFNFDNKPEFTKGL